MTVHVGIIPMFNKISKAVLGCLLAVTAATSFAQESAVPSSYLTLDYNHVFRDSNRASTDGNGGAIGYGLTLNPIWTLEFGGFYNTYGRNDFRTTDWNEYGLKVDTLFFYSRRPLFSPYWVLGLGGVRSSERVSNQHSTDPFVDIGLGVFHYFNVADFDFGIRADARFRWLDTKGIAAAGSMGEPIIKVGFVLPFGMARSSGNTASSPEPQPAAAAAEPVEATPPPVALTDAEEARARILAPVHFKYKQSDLTPAARSILDGAAATIQDMAKQSPVKVRLNGHTDNIGSDGYNQSLSEMRAETVGEYLTKKGVDAKSISTNAYGKTLPDKDNATEEGRAYNRRVEVKVVPQQ